METGQIVSIFWLCSAFCGPQLDSCLENIHFTAPTSLYLGHRDPPRPGTRRGCPSLRADQTTTLRSGNSCQIPSKSTIFFQHGHYAHLHAAYSHLSSNRAHSELESQIIQLQSVFLIFLPRNLHIFEAVSVLVEEKTTLQAELRVAREQCEQIATSHIKVGSLCWKSLENLNFRSKPTPSNSKPSRSCGICVTSSSRPSP